ncbi:MAG: fibronectin type III domain-containing protein [Bacteroidales bacterium]|nr:fibronectin type III domain-containing protein [Bacteroidales bacterium]
MTKKVIVLFLAVLLAHGVVGAQTSMAVPCGSFEQWTSHSGYSVTAGFIPVSVYSSYSTPTGWNYLTYPVNETYSIIFSTVNINTDIPLIKASQETAGVPAGNSAVKLQTFMLSDIVSSTVYNVASGSLDPELTTTVYPSILSTGVVNIEHFIPIMNDLISNMDDMSAILAMMTQMDVNYYITGGIPMGTFEPTYLSGSYKYNSAVSGDNGGVLILGTRYNNTLHRREVVGGGVNTALTDCNVYTPFTVDYLSLHEYDASYAEQTPDSLIVMLISSAGTNRQQGSYLCVDNLNLWHVDPPTCADVTSLTANATIHEATLSWATAAAVDGFEMEYGTAGFVEGQGTSVNFSNGSTNSYTLEGLNANTQYTIRLRSTCTNGAYGDWVTASFTTLPDTCAHVTSLTATAAIHEATVSWSTTAAVNAIEMEYGIAGFTEGQGTSITLGGSQTQYTINGLEASTQYTVRMRSACTNGAYGDWVSTNFTTFPDTCAHVTSLTATAAIHEATINWSTGGTVSGVEMEYGVAGFAEGQGSSMSINSGTMTHFTIHNLEGGTQYDVRLRTVCSNSIYGDWQTASFTTLPDTCARIVAVTVDSADASLTDENLVAGYVASWQATFEPDSWEVEYGTESVPFTTITTQLPTLDFPPLQPSSIYELRVRPVCHDDIYGDWASMTFRTKDTVATIPIDTTTISINEVGVKDYGIKVFPNPAHGHCVVDLTVIQEAVLRLYTQDGRLVQTVEYKPRHGATVTLQLPEAGVFMLQIVTPDGVMSWKIINR